MSQHLGFAGSWRVMATDQEPPELSLATFGADGTAMTSPQPVMPSPSAAGEVIFTSAGHGAWAATGLETAIVTFVVLVADGHGNLLLTVTVRATITLGPDGKTFSGEGIRVFADPLGKSVMTAQATIQATRIVAEAPAA